MTVAARRSGRPRILVVDDETDIADLVTSTLRDAGFDVSIAHDGPTALERVAADAPDLVVLDVMLPGLSGIEVARRLRDELVGVTPRILFLTAWPDQRISAFAGGADDFLTKPFLPEELVVRVAAVLRRAEELRCISPLTGLPGNAEVYRRLEAAVAEADQHFALIWADLDNFKAYNDVYGFLRGDRAISATARLLADEVAGLASRPRFVGHIGGDDFVLLVPDHAAETAADRIVEAFDVLAPTLFDPVDRERGYIVARSRSGGLHDVPLLTISLGVATTAHRRFERLHEAIEVANQTRAWAKAQPGSAYRVDQRHIDVADTA